MKKLQDFTDLVAAASTPDEVRAALTAWEGKIEPAMEAIAAKGAAFDEGLLMTMAVSGAFIGAIGKNPNLTPEMGEWLAAWMIRRSGVEAKKDRMYSAINCVVSLSRGEKVDWEGPTMQEVRRFFVEGGGTGGVRKREAYAYLVALHPQADADALHAVAEKAVESLDFEGTTALATHPNANIVTRRAVMAAIEYPPREHLQRLVESEPLVSDAEIRAELLRFAVTSAQWQILEPVITASTDTEIAESFRSLVSRSNLYTASALLKHCRDRLASSLTEQDLLPLLECSEQSIRLEAITALPSLRARVPEEPARTR